MGKGLESHRLQRALCPGILCSHLRPPGPWGGGCWDQNSKPIPQTHTWSRGTKHCHILFYCWAVLGVGGR